MIVFETRTGGRWVRKGTLTRDPQGHLVPSNGRVQETVVGKKIQGMTEDQIWDYLASGVYANAYFRARLEETK